MGTEKELTISGHLKELRARLIRSLLVVAGATAVSFFFAKQIFHILALPAQGVDLVYIEMTEMIGTYMKVSLLSGLALAMPYLVYQLVRFIAPALTGREKRYLYLLLPGAVAAFVLGIAFCYFILLPPALNFLLTFGSDIASPQIKIGSYVSLVSTLLFSIGVAFETPVVIFFLSKLGVVSPKFLARQRKWVFLAAFVLGAIITPTMDPINQSLVAGTIIALYEFGILLARLAQITRPAQRYVTSDESPP